MRAGGQEDNVQWSKFASSTLCSMNRAHLHSYLVWLCIIIPFLLLLPPSLPHFLPSSIIPSFPTMSRSMSNLINLASREGVEERRRKEREEGRRGKIQGVFLSNPCWRWIERVGHWGARWGKYGRYGRWGRGYGVGEMKKIWSDGGNVRWILERFSSSQEVFLFLDACFRSWGNDDVNYIHSWSFL